MKKIRIFIDRTNFIYRFMAAYPILCNIFIVIYMIMSLMECDLCSFVGQFRYIIGHTFLLNVFLLSLSIKYRMCFWHRALIYSMLLISAYSFAYGFGFEVSHSTYLALTISTISLLLTTVSLYYGRIKTK